MTNHVPSEMDLLLIEFIDVFHKPTSLPSPRAIEHSIDLVLRASFPNAPAYRLAPWESEEIECQIGQLLESGHIQPLYFPSTSPAFIIPKKDDH